ncbi:YbaK/EbsC family protein [Nanoarchaeota archaeon]
MMAAFEKIKQLLEEKGIEYEFKEHEAVRTSEEAAAVRGDDLKIGAKALVFKAGDRFVMCVLSAAKKIDSKRLKKILGTKKLRFATPEEVMNKTGCEPGGVPPFGNVFELDVYVDKSLLENEFMAFNAGERTKSLRMKTEDYLQLVRPEVREFGN